MLKQQSPPNIGQLAETLVHSVKSEAFAGGVQETVISPGTSDALTAVPEVVQLEEQRTAPVTVRERAVMGKQPVHLLDAHGIEISPSAAQERYLRKYLHTSGRHWRQQFLENFQPQREGLDLQQGDSFMQSLGLAATTSTLELPGDLRNDINAVYPRSDWEHIGGIYLEVSDFALIFRDRRLEELNGPELTEKIRVHELAHSSQSQEFLFTVRDDGTLDVKATKMYIGYRAEIDNPEAGGFFLEGAAELVAGQYTAEVLGKPHGLLDLPEETHTVFTERANNKPVPVCASSRYVYLNSRGEHTTSWAGEAASGLELLIARDPALRPALMHGLYDPEARREVQGRIDAIRPGMFEKLHKDPVINGQRTVNVGLSYIQHMVGDH